jgi:hypothetical protein
MVAGQSRSTSAERSCDRQDRSQPSAAVPVAQAIQKRLGPAPKLAFPPSNVVPTLVSPPKADHP